MSNRKYAVKTSFGEDTWIRRPGAGSSHPGKSSRFIFCSRKEAEESKKEYERLNQSTPVTVVDVAREEAGWTECWGLYYYIAKEWVLVHPLSSTSRKIDYKTRERALEEERMLGSERVKARRFWRRVKPKECSEQTGMPEVGEMVEIKAEVVSVGSSAFVVQLKDGTIAYVDGTQWRKDCDERQ